MGREALLRGYVLHRHDYRDTSLLVELFTESHGRVGVVARGVKGRRGGGRQALLQPFAPLLLSWSGRGELQTLTAVESRATLAPLRGAVLMSAFYLNELLLRLLRRHDPHPELFLYYDRLLPALAELAPEGGAELAIALRRFEWRLLIETGYAPVIDHDQQGRPVEPGGYYLVRPEQGPVAADPAARGALRGEHLLALATDRLDEASARAVRPLLRSAIDRQLGGRPLRSRQTMEALRRRFD